MIRVRWTALFAFATLLLGALPASADSAGFEERLQQAIAAGEVDAGRDDLYRLYRLRAADRLPEVLRAAVGRSALVLEDAQRPSRHGTGEMRLLRARLARAPADIRAEAERYLSAAPAATEGPAAARVAGKTGGNTLLNRVVTDNFSVEWGSSLTNELGDPWTDTGPDFTGDPAVGDNGVPDVVERWAAYLEASWGVVIDELGFAPMELSTSLVPVYLGNSDPDTGIDDINSTQLFGFTDYAGTGVPHLVVNNDFSAFPVPGLTSVAAIQPLMKVTAAHEFFHVLHFLHEPPLAAAVWQEDIWWWEASAIWLEDEVFDSVDDYHTWLDAGGWPDFVEAGLAPHFSDRNYAPRAYGAVIFAKYLEEHVGGRDSMWQVWERIRAGGTTADGMRVLDAFGDYAVNRGFDDLEQLFLGFVGANAVMDYEEGADYGQVDAAAPVSGLTPPVFHLGAAYRTRSSGATAGLEISAVSAPTTDWGLSGVLVKTDGYSLVIGERLGGGAVPVVRFVDVGSNDSVFAATSWLTDAGPVSFTLAEAAFTNVDATAPDPVMVENPLPQAGGFDLAWTSPGGSGAGTVVRWKPAGLGRYTGFRTLFGPVSRVEVRGLTTGTYDLQAFAYDEVGNADSEAAATVSVTVSDPGSDATVPQSGAAIPNALVQALEFGTPPSGGGGGGCFLRALVF